jgi:hypothetical protein
VARGLWFAFSPFRSRHIRPDYAEGAGWNYKIKLTEPLELDTLLDREAYLAYVQEQG